MHVHFVNLDRSTQRLAEFKATNSHLKEVTRIPAIEESLIDLGALEQQGLIKGDILSMYPIGGLCRALTDLAFWTRTIESGKPQTIADDDAIFNLNFDTCAPELIKSLPPDWDLVLWGFNFDLFMIFEMLPGVTHCTGQFDQDRMRLNTRKFQELSIVPRAHKLIWSFGMTSYTVSPKGAQFLKEKCFPLQPLLIPCPEGFRTPPHSYHYRTVGIDNTINGLYKQMNAYVCFPPLVISRNEPTKSTIQSRGEGATSYQPGTTIPAQGATKQEDLVALTRQAVEFHTQQRFQEALATFDKIIALYPNVIEAHYNRATILGDMGRFDEALTAYDKILLLKPDFVFALNNRGWILQKLHRYQEALASYDKALTIDPNYAAAKSNRELLLNAQRQTAAQAGK